MSTRRFSKLLPAALTLTLAGGAFAALSNPAQETGKKTGLETGQEGDQEGAEKPQAEGEENVLHESMERLQKSMKGLRKLMRNPEDKADAMALCVEMEAAALEGFLHAPVSPDGLEGSELLAYQADFKKRMLAVAGVLVDMELALDAGDADKTKELYRTLGAQKKDGHEIYEK